MDIVEVIRKLSAESIKNRTFAQGEPPVIATPALAKSDAYNHAIQVLLNMQHYQNGCYFRKEQFIETAKEFFAWFNKSYPDQMSNDRDHPWCKMGEAIVNLELSGAKHE